MILLKRNWIMVCVVCVQNSISSCADYQTDTEVEIEKTEEEPAPERFILDHSHIVLSVDSLDDYFVVSLDYLKVGEKKKTPPRVAEIRISYPNSAEYLEHQSGKSLAESGKQLIVQNPEPGIIRLVIVASDNTNPIGSGRLATLKLKKTDDTPATIGILTDKPIFAPEEANEGLLVSDPITI